MIRLPKGDGPLNGAILSGRLAAAGLETGVLLVGDVIELADLDAPAEGEALAALEAHRADAQASLDAAANERSNESSIRQRATAALQSNRDFLALQAPTSAQVVAQVKALTRQNQGLIRLTLRRFDGSD